MDGRLIWIDCNEAGYYVVPNVLSPRDLVSRPDDMDETVPHTLHEVPLIAEQKKISNKWDTICSHWNSYILSIKLRTKSNIDIVQKINVKDPR